MLAFAMMAAIRHRANPPPPKKSNAEPRQTQKHRHAVIDPLVNPGSPPHRRSKANPTRKHHRMVTLGVELTRQSLSARTSKQKGNCNARRSSGREGQVRPVPTPPS
jgi:hypothetical protein